LLETRVSPRTDSVDGHFIVDQHPELDNVWIVGGGSGHGFKHGPMMGEHVAQRVAGKSTSSELVETFRLKDAEF
jgi:glycine/D-amino acid oxidase-like deaminating enzyme